MMQPSDGIDSKPSLPFSMPLCIFPFQNRMGSWKKELSWVTALVSELLSRASGKSLSGYFNNTLYILVCHYKAQVLQSLRQPLFALVGLVVER